MAQLSPLVRDITLDDLKAGLADGSIALVDVREPHEFAAAAVPGSISLPLSRFDPDEIPTGRRVVFSCGSGVRSIRAIELSRAAGLDLSEHYPGGIRGWIAAGEQVVPGGAAT